VEDQLHTKLYFKIKNGKRKASFNDHRHVGIAALKQLHTEITLPEAY